MKLAPVLAIALLTVIDAFQIAIAFGAPFGRAAWGGANPGTLPQRFRIASGIAGALLYPLIALVVAAQGGLIEFDGLPRSRNVMWGLTGIFVVGGVLNLATRSPLERYWGPVSLAIAGCCAVIAVS